MRSLTDSWHPSQARNRKMMVGKYPSIENLDSERWADNQQAAGNVFVCLSYGILYQPVKFAQAKLL